MTIAEPRPVLTTRLTSAGPVAEAQCRSLRLKRYDVRRAIG